jgi:hypothetical protein
MPQPHQTIPQPHQIYIGTLSRRQRSWGRVRRRPALVQVLASTALLTAAAVAVVAGLLGHF